MAMGSEFSTRPCPQCGALSPFSSPYCTQCGYQFSDANSSIPGKIKAIGAIVLGILLVALGVAILISFIPASTPALQQAVDLAKASSQVHGLLGSGIKSEWPPLGITKKRVKWEFSEFTVHLSGSKGSGHLYGVANAVNGKWGFSRLSFVADRNAQKVDLTPSPDRETFPLAPKKKVYLVPVGLEERESLEWAAAYYGEKFGIDVEILPAEAIPDGMEEAAQHQVDSERLIERMRIEHTDLVADPANILIGVTSRDMTTPSLGETDAENFRQDGRFAMISSSLLHPSGLSKASNPEWFRSRLQKLIGKNIALLYFDLPLSSDPTSLLAYGTHSGSDWDRESESIIGANGEWTPLADTGDFEVTTYEAPNEPPMWHLSDTRENPQETGTRVFNTDLSDGLFLYRKTDFALGGPYPLALTRVYNSKDSQMRPFGMGMNDSLDIFLVGEMEKWVDLVFEDGGRVHFNYAPDKSGPEGELYQGGQWWLFSGANAYYKNDSWTVKRPDGWKYFFPYLPSAPNANVTILTGFSDPAGHRYEMSRDPAGYLQSVNAPGGNWLHFERDEQHRVHVAGDSAGRQVTYDYDAAGHLVRITDSEGGQEQYAYDDQSRLVTVSTGSAAPIFENTYDSSGNIVSQTMSDGRSFDYHYVQGFRVPKPSSTDKRDFRPMLPDQITDPNGSITTLRYRGLWFLQSLPSLQPASPSSMPGSTSR